MLKNNPGGSADTEEKRGVITWFSVFFGCTFLNKSRIFAICYLPL